MKLFNAILTIFQRHSHPFSLFFQTKSLWRKKGVGVRIEVKKKLSQSQVSSKPISGTEPPFPKEKGAAGQSPTGIDS